MNKGELKIVLDNHCKWLNGDNDGKKANLSGANLSWANLSGANLQIGNFHRWHYTATSRDLRIGCQLHTWADWKAKGAAIAKEYDCAAEFKAFWPVLDATRKNLQKRFPTK